MADGREITVSFSLAFVSHPAAPWLGLFACQHHTPEYFAQPRYLHHANGATGVQEVWIAGDTAPELAGFMQIVAGAKAVKKIQTLRCCTPEPARLCWRARKRSKMPSDPAHRIRRTVRTSPALPLPARHWAR
jgi:hypothetical protein